MPLKDKGSRRKRDGAPARVLLRAAAAWQRIL